MRAILAFLLAVAFALGAAWYYWSGAFHPAVTLIETRRGAAAEIVAEITPKGDPATRTFRVFLSLPEDTLLRIGMSVEANIVTREKQDALLQPAEAIAEGHVYVVADGRLARRRIETGIRGTRYIEIPSGLSEGQRVASPAPTGLREGVRVSVRVLSPP